MFDSGYLYGFRLAYIKGVDKITVKDCYFAIDVDENVKFYRAEVFDETRNLRIAIGNPIWNERFMIK